MYGTRQEERSTRWQERPLCVDRAHDQIILSKRGGSLSFPCTSLAFHTLFDVLLWRPNRKGSQWMHPLEVSPLWTNAKKFPYPNLLTVVQLLKRNTGTVDADKAESDNASPSCYCRRYRALTAELRVGSYGAMCDFSVLLSVAVQGTERERCYKPFSKELRFRDCAASRI